MLTVKGVLKKYELGQNIFRRESVATLIEYIEQLEQKNSNEKIAIYFVKDEEHFVAIEIEHLKKFYFFAVRQDLWNGLRNGKFPNRNDGSCFEREVAMVI